MHPKMIEAVTFVVQDVLELLDKRAETNPTMDRQQLIEICVAEVMGRSEFDKRSILRAEPGLTVPRAVVLMELYRRPGHGGMLGQVVHNLTIPKQTAYARLSALIKHGLVEQDRATRGFYQLTERGVAAARAMDKEPGSAEALAADRELAQIAEEKRRPSTKA